MKTHILCFIKEFSFICVIVLQRTAGESCNNNSSFKIHVIKNLISWNFLRNGLNAVLFNYQHILYITLCNFINFNCIALCQKILTSISQKIFNDNKPACLLTYDERSIYSFTLLLPDDIQLKSLNWNFTYNAYHGVYKSTIRGVLKIHKHWP